VSPYIFNAPQCLVAQVAFAARFDDLGSWAFGDEGGYCALSTPLLKAPRRKRPAMFPVVRIGEDFDEALLDGLASLLFALRASALRKRNQYAGPPAPCNIPAEFQKTRASISLGKLRTPQGVGPTLRGSRGSLSP